MNGYMTTKRSCGKNGALHKAVQTTVNEPNTRSTNAWNNLYDTGKC